MDFLNLEVYFMNDFGQLQLIWIRRLASETGRITALMEAGDLSVINLVRYKKSISEIDDYCRFVIEAQDWDNVKEIPKIVDEVEEKLFVHFYELIDHFDSEDAHLDSSNDDEYDIVLDLNDNPLRDVLFSLIDDEDMDIFL